MALEGICSHRVSEIFQAIFEEVGNLRITAPSGRCARNPIPVSCSTSSAFSIAIHNYHALLKCSATFAYSRFLPSLNLPSSYLCSRKMPFGRRITPLQDTTHPAKSSHDTVEIHLLTPSWSSPLLLHSLLMPSAITCNSMFKKLVCCTAFSQASWLGKEVFWGTWILDDQSDRAVDEPWYRAKAGGIYRAFLHDSSYEGAHLLLPEGILRMHGGSFSVDCHHFLLKNKWLHAHGTE